MRILIRTLDCLEEVKFQREKRGRQSGGLRRQVKPEVASCSFILVSWFEFVLLPLLHLLFVVIHVKYIIFDNSLTGT